MSDQTADPRPSPTRRRSSLVEMFTSRPSIPNAGNISTNAVSSSPPSTVVPPSPNPPQHRRGASITALGLTTSPQGQTSPFGAFARQRRASVATSSSGSPEFRNSFGDEPAVLEDDETGKSPANTPTSPLGRRLSFGAQALRDVKQSGSPGSPGAGRRSSSSLFTLSESNENHPLQPTSDGPGVGASSTAKTAGEGFNWSDSLRDRTKRSPSFSSGNPFSANTVRPRATSNAVVEPPKEMPKPVEPVTRMKKPDHLGERMLRGDFMMD